MKVLATNESASLKLLTTTTEDWIVGMRNDGTSNFRIYSYGAGSDVFSILRSNGKVGIGSTNPTARLYVVETANNAWALQVKGTGTSANYGLEVNCSAGYALSSQPFKVDTPSGGPFFIDGNSNVGIGDGSPTYKLDVNGTGRFTGALTGTSATFSGLVTIDQNANATSLRIDSEATTDQVIEIDAPLTTTASVLDINDCNSLISGKIAYFRSNSSSANGRNLVEIVNDHVSATGTTPLKVIQDAPTWSANILNTHAVGYGLSIDTSADTGSAVYNLACYTGTNSGFFVTNQGRVGIGVTAPATKLEVASGNVRLTDSYVIEWGGTKARIGGSNAGDFLKFYTDDTPRIYVISDGNVGIGSATPALLFDVNSSRTHNFIGRFVNTSTVGWGAYIEGGGDSDDYSLLIRNQASSDLFAIMGDGEIRVANQTLVDSSNSEYTMTFPDEAGIAMGSAYTYANIYGKTGNLYLRANSYPANTGSNGIIYLQTSNSSGGQAADVVVNNGKVGIGTAAPSEMLDIETGDPGGHIELNNPDSGGNSYVIGITDTAGTSYGPAGSLFIRDGGNARLVIKSDGKVGIGVTDPDNKLEVNGDISTSTTNQAIMARYSNNNAYAALLGWSSVADGCILQLGNNNANNEIRAGHTGTGGGLKIITNNTADYTAVHNGTVALAFTAAGAATFGGEVDIHPSLNKRILITFPTDETTNESRIGFSDLNAYITYKAATNFMEIWSYNSLYLQTGSGKVTALTISSAQGATFSSSVTAVSFSGNGASISALNALNISSGTVATARLGTGTANSSTFLAGNNTWATPSNTTYSAGTGLTLSSTTFSTKLDELTDMTADVNGAQDELILLDNGSDRRKQINEIKLGQFNNDQGWTSNAGTVTSVTAGTGMTQTGSASGVTTLNVGGGTGIVANASNVALALSELGATNAPTTVDTFVFDDAGTPARYAAGNIQLSIFENNSGWTSNSGTITGSGTDHYVPRFNGTTGLQNSSILVGDDNIVLIGDNTDTYAIIGRAKVGYIGHGDYAGFAHRDVGTTTSYALIQDSVGSTFLNAANAKTISFRINNADVIKMDATSFYSSASGVEDLGKSTKRWNNVYSEAGNFSGTVTGGTFSGSGASLNTLNASELDSGTVPAARLGNVYAGSTAADVISASNGTIGAVDAATDKLVFWDEDAGKLKYLTFSSLDALP